MSRFLAQLALFVTTSLFVLSMLHGPIHTDADQGAYYPPTAESRRLIQMNLDAEEAEHPAGNPQPMAQIE